MNPALDFLLEINGEAAKSVAKYGYNKMLNNEYGIECEVKFDLEKYLEFKYKLDKNIC